MPFIAHLEVTLDNDIPAEDLDSFGDFIQGVAQEAIAIQNLIGECGGPWSTHPDYPPADWMTAVESFDTRLGYWDWVLARLEAADDDDDDDDDDS